MRGEVDFGGKIREEGSLDFSFLILRLVTDGTPRQNSSVINI